MLDIVIVRDRVTGFYIYCPIFVTFTLKYSTKFTWGWRDGLAIKSTCYFYKGLKFGFPLPTTGSSQSSETQL